MPDVKTMTDAAVEAAASKTKTVTVQVPVVKPADSRFTFYQADAASSTPGAWRCMVQSGDKVSDVLVADAVNADVGAVLKRLWLLANGAAP